LERSFQSEENEQAKTHIAGALVRLRSAQDEPVAWQWLLQSRGGVSARPTNRLGCWDTFSGSAGTEQLST